MKRGIQGVRQNENLASFFLKSSYQNVRGTTYVRTFQPPSDLTHLTTTSTPSQLSCIISLYFLLSFTSTQMSFSTTNNNNERRMHPIMLECNVYSKRKRRNCNTTPKTNVNPIFSICINYPIPQLQHLRDIGLVEDFDVCLLQQAHVHYLTSALRAPLKASFVSLDSSRPWIMYWCLHSLDLMDALPAHHVLMGCVDTSKHVGLPLPKMVVVVLEEDRVKWPMARPRMRQSWSCAWLQRHDERRKNTNLA